MHACVHACVEGRGVMVVYTLCLFVGLVLGSLVLLGNVTGDQILFGCV